MKLADRPTPESDYVLGSKNDSQDKGLPVIMRSLEQRLAHAVEALQFYARFKGVGEVAQEALSEIEAAK